MNWTNEVEEGNFDGIIGKLKKHGYFGDFILEALFACYCTVMFIVDEWSLWYLMLALASVGILARTLELAFTKERAETAEAKAMDLADGLIVKTRENERLTLELETTQAALVEAKKPKMHYSGYVQTGLAQVESSAIATTIDVTTSEAPLPKPKRKPAPRGTRKPKTKNENKD